MYSEQLAVLLFIAATHAATPGIHAQPMAQMPRDAAQKVGLQVKVEKPRKTIRREREATMLAEFR
jgi:hypothetical protein